MVKKKKCFECKKEFEVKPTARYVRKYCDTCGKKRKRHKIATHKRKKRLRKNRHKKK